MAEAGAAARWPATTPRPRTGGTNKTAATVSAVVRLRVTLLMRPLLEGFAMRLLHKPVSGDRSIPPQRPGFAVSFGRVWFRVWLACFIWQDHALGICLALRLARER